MPTDLHDWFRFIRAQSHILKEHPEKLFQLAVNEPDDSIIALAAKEQAERQSDGRRWIEWISKPQHKDACVLTLATFSQPNQIDVRNREMPYDCAYAPNGKSIATTADNVVAIWDAQTGQQKLTLSNHSSWVAACAYSTDSRWIVSAARNGLAVVWDAQSGDIQRTLEGHTAPVSVCRYSPDGSRIVTSARDGSMRIWAADTAELRFETTEHSDAITDCHYSPAGDQIVSISNDKTMKFWDAETARCLFTVALPEPLTACGYSPNGRQIVVSSGQVLAVWDTVARKKICTLAGHNDLVSDCVYSPDGRLIASVSWDKTLILWNVETASPVGRANGHRDAVSACDYSPDGRWIVTAGYDRIPRVWDVDHIRKVWTDSLEESVRESKPRYKGLQLQPTQTQPEVYVGPHSADGERTITLARHLLKVSDASSGKEVATLSGHSKDVNNFVFSADGRLVVSGSRDGSLILWDVSRGKKVRSFGFLSAHQDRLEDCAFSADGKRIVSASLDNTLKVWNATNGKLIFTLEGHSQAVFACVFSPDDRQILSASSDDSLKIWNAKNGTEVKTLLGHERDVTACAYSPDGKLIASVSQDQTIRIWDTNGCELSNFSSSHRLLKPNFVAGGTTVVVRDIENQILTLCLVGIDVDTPLVTPVYVYRFEKGIYDEQASVKCLWCDKWFNAPHALLKTLEEYENVDGSGAELRDERLLIQCTLCGHPLRSNPFIVDNRQRSFWRSWR